MHSNFPSPAKTALKDESQASHKKAWRLAGIASLLLSLMSCASHPLEVVRNEKPVFKPERFFAGRTKSWGVFENKSGQPTKLIYTETTGRWDGKALHFEQAIDIPQGKKSHRSWLIQPLDEHHYSVTGTDIIGVAHGETSGNAFHLEFTIDALPGNPLGHLHMSQWMYLQPDGVTLINRDHLTKAGLFVTAATEQFRRVR
ncbi:MAG: lipoprotein [Verrucomicrobiaceae bacterium]|nr:lipoprotein [Verrucomicrobiaceae bacterium]